ncbi:hypothetical protein LTR15_011247 [Elasticomyces elasticus]|nr:hypothetical protein LTR15_011247 [Elasticomyces elasticus]
MQRASTSRPPRLINVLTGLLEPVNWQAPNASSEKRYAILSHTWGPDESEVTFSEWKDGSGRLKAGYRKIEGACRQAETDGWSYIWVDTCCIDKANNNELTKAINSMFHWYANSEICYALLSDVSGLSSQGNTLERVRASRWFTRGWTLQEFIAPSKVHFYAQDWSSLQSRDTMLQALAELTGIDAAVLAHRRITKEPEDRAYSLLGIVGVDMPLVYGEGDKAFRRLQVAALTTSRDLSVLAWGHVGPERSTSLFAASPSDFLGSSRTIVDPSRKPTEHWMTSSGLRSTIFVCTASEGQDTLSTSVLAILGCRPESSPDLVLTLRLKTEGGPLVQNDTLTVDPLRDVRHASLLPRLKLLPAADVARAIKVHATILFTEEVSTQGTNGRPEPQVHNVESESTPLLDNPSREGTTPASSRSGSLAETTLQEQRAMSKSTILLWLGGLTPARKCGLFVLVAVAVGLIVFCVTFAAIHQSHGGKDGKSTTSSASGIHSATSDSRASETASSIRTSSTISESTTVSPSDTHSITSKFTASGTASASSTSSTIAVTSSTSTPRSTPAPIQVAEDSGIAVVAAEGNSFYGYYQNSHGEIVEAEFLDASFVAIASADRNRTVVTAESTFLGTPIAATSWTSRSGTVHRALFFQNLDDMILVTNTTGTESWSEPYGILDTDLAAPEGRVLAAASGNSSTGFNGVRVYYASASGVIQEVGTDFDGSDDGISKQTWHTWYSFEKSYPKDRVGLTVSGAEVHLYLSNKMTFMMQQWRWNVRSRKQWQPGDEFWAMQAVAAAHEKTTDHETTDQVFLLDTHGGIQRTRCISGHFDGLGGTLKIADGTSASYVTAIPIYSTSGNGVMVLYHAADNPTQFSFQVVANNGTITAAGIWQSSVDLV